jgi:hypothetical protein
MRVTKHQQQSKKRKLKKEKKLLQYAGCLKLAVEPLKFQRQIRNEWR